MERKQPAKVVAMTADLLRQGRSLRQVAKIVGLSHTTVAKIGRSAGIPCRPRVGLDPSKRSSLIRELKQGTPIYLAAARCSVSRDTAHRYSRQINATPGEMQFHRTRTAKVCPYHGRVRVWPCVACAAEGRITCG